MQTFAAALEQRGGRALPLPYYLRTRVEDEAGVLPTQLPATDAQRTRLERRTFFDVLQNDTTDYALLTTFLLGGVDVNARRDVDGATALHIAAAGTTAVSPLQCVAAAAPTVTRLALPPARPRRALAQSGKHDADNNNNNNDDDDDDDDGGAHDCHNLLIVSFLLDNGADINAQTRDGGVTALMLAAGLQRVRMMRLLLQRGASLHTRDALGRTCLFYAALHPHVLQALIAFTRDRRTDGDNNNNNSNEKKNSVNVGKRGDEDVDKAPAWLLTALQQQHVLHDVCTVPGTRFAALHLIEQLGVRVNDAAMSSSSSSSLSSLSLSSAAMADDDDDNASAVIVGSSSGSGGGGGVDGNGHADDEAAQATQQHETHHKRRHMRWAPGATPLHCAVTTGDVALVKALLSCGAACDARDAAGTSPVMLAYQLQRTHVRRHGGGHVASCVAAAAATSHAASSTSGGGGGGNDDDDNAADEEALLVSLPVPRHRRVHTLLAAFSKLATSSSATGCQQREHDDDHEHHATTTTTATAATALSDDATVRAQQQRLLQLAADEEGVAGSCRDAGVLRPLFGCTGGVPDVAHVLLAAAVPQACVLALCALVRVADVLVLAVLALWVALMVYMSRCTRNNNNNNSCWSTAATLVVRRRRMRLHLFGLCVGVWLALVACTEHYHNTCNALATHYSYYACSDATARHSFAMTTIWVVLLRGVQLAVLPLALYVILSRPHTVTSTAGQRKGIYALLARRWHAHTTRAALTATAAGNKDGTGASGTAADVVAELHRVDVPTMVRKPLRAQRCPVLQRVVLRYDHYCDYLLCCVGAHNHRAFVYLHIVLLCNVLLCVYYTLAVREVLVAADAAEAEALQRVLPQLLTRATDTATFTSHRLAAALAAALTSPTAATAAAVDGSSRAALAAALMAKVSAAQPVPFSMSHWRHRVVFTYTHVVLPLVLFYLVRQLYRQLRAVARNVTVYDMAHAETQSSAYCFRLHGRGRPVGGGGVDTAAAAAVSAGGGGAVYSLFDRGARRNVFDFLLARDELAAQVYRAPALPAHLQRKLEEEQQWRPYGEEDDVPADVKAEAGATTAAATKCKDCACGGGGGATSTTATAVAAAAAAAVAAGGADTTAAAAAANTTPRPVQSMAQLLFEQMVRSGTDELVTGSHGRAGAASQTQREWDEAVEQARRMYAFFAQARRNAAASMFMHGNADLVEEMQGSAAPDTAPELHHASHPKNT